MKKFDKLPVKVQKRMLDCQVEQGNEANSEVFMKNIDYSRMSKGFDWVSTKEGYSAWYSAIYKDNYTSLYAANPDLIP